MRDSLYSQHRSSPWFTGRQYWILASHAKASHLLELFPSRSFSDRMSGPGTQWLLRGEGRNGILPLFSLLLNLCSQWLCLCQSLLFWLWPVQTGKQGIHEFNPSYPVPWIIHRRNSLFGKEHRGTGLSRLNILDMAVPGVARRGWMSVCAKDEVTDRDSLRSGT